MTRRPLSSTPPLTGEACGLPSARSVISSMWWRGRTNSSSSSSPTSVFVAMVGAMTSRLASGHRLPRDPHPLDAGGADLVGGVEGIAVEEDEVGDRAGLHHPGVVAVAHPRGAGGVGGERHLEGEGLVGEERLAPGAPGLPVRRPV